MPISNFPVKDEIYQHFKGNLYQIVAIAQDSEDLSHRVVYQDLSDPKKIWVRPLNDFCGYKIIDGHSVKRFEGPIRIASSKGFGGLGPK